MVQDFDSDHLPILLTIPLSIVFHSDERPPSFNFLKARWNDFAFTLTVTVLSQRNTRLFLFPLLLLSSLALNAAKSSIWDGFNQPKPGSRTILFTIDFLKAFDSVWYPALFYKLISAGFLPCFARWTKPFLSDACVVYQNHKSRFFQVRRGVLPGFSFLALYFFLFSSMICLLLCHLPSAALSMLTISPLVLPPRSLPRWRLYKELRLDWSAGLSTGVFLLIRANVRPPSQWIS